MSSGWSPSYASSTSLANSSAFSLLFSYSSRACAPRISYSSSTNKSSSVSTATSADSLASDKPLSCFFCSHLSLTFARNLSAPMPVSPVTDVFVLLANHPLTTSSSFSESLSAVDRSSSACVDVSSSSESLSSDEISSSFDNASSGHVSSIESDNSSSSFNCISLSTMISLESR